MAEEPPPFLFKHSLLACSSPPLLVAPLSLMYSLILSFQLPHGLPLLLDFTHINFPHKLHCSSSQYGQTMSMYFFSPIPSLHTLYLILPASKWSSFPTRTLNFTHTFLTNSTVHPLNMAKPPQCISFHPFHHSHSLLYPSSFQIAFLSY